MKIEKLKKLPASLHDKTENKIHVKNSKEALNYELVLKNIYRMIKFNQNAWLKWYLDMNTNLRKKFFKLMKNAVFSKNYGK